MAMMMAGRVLLVCALCVLWCGVCGVYARNPDNNSLGGYMASGGFGRNKSFLSTGSSKNLSTPPLLSASFISAIQAEAREGEVSSPGVTDSPLSGATGLSPAFSGLGPAVPGPGPGFVHGHVHGPAGPGDGAAAFSGLGAAGPDPVCGPAFSGPDANIFGAPVPGNGPAAIPGAPVSGHGPAAIPGAPVPGNGPAFSGLGAAVPGHGPAAIPGAPVPGNGPAFSGLGAAVPGDGAAAFSGRGAAIADAAIPGAAGPVRGVDAPIPGPAVPGDGPAFSGLGAAGPGHVAAIPGAAVPGTADPAAIPGSAVLGHGAIPGSISDAAIPGPASPGAAAAFSSLGAAFSGAGHSVVGGSEPPNSRSVVISSNEGGNGKTTPVSVSSDEQIVSPQEVLAQKETGSQHTSLPEEQPTVSSNNEKQRNNFASAGGRSLGHNAAGHELQDSLEEQNKNEHSQTNETKKSSGDQITEFQSSGKEISEVSNTTTHGVKTQQPKTNSVNEKNYSQNTDASHTTSPLLLLLLVVCAAAAAVVAA
ncbi:Mucin-associated surface protein (MASP), subgroup S043 [Trypanosoma cruzi]|nr:Mucin-associated surface protein (MASP), subgroup S043 [Trypanosoma cruzi]